MSIQFIANATRFDRFLATHIGFFARRWQRKVQEELAVHAGVALVIARRDVSAAAATYVLQRYISPGEEERYEALLKAVIAEQNAVIRFKAYRHEGEQS